MEGALLHAIVQGARLLEALLRSIHLSQVTLGVNFQRQKERGDGSGVGRQNINEIYMGGVPGVWLE